MRETTAEKARFAAELEASMASASRVAPRILYSGVLGRGVSAQVFVTGDVRPEHVERLRQNLALTSDALADV